MRRALPLLGPLLAGALLVGCGGGSSTLSPTPTPATATPTVSAAPGTPMPTAASSPTALGATLVITEYGVAITLPAGIADATYRIDASMAEGNEDVNGNPVTELPGVRVWTKSLATDAACSSVEQDGLVAISVFPSDPSALDLPEGPSDFQHVGQDWFGISEEQAYGCSDGNPNEWPAVQALNTAFGTLHAA